jgi:hypothetical protein
MDDQQPSHHITSILTKKEKSLRVETLLSKHPEIEKFIRMKKKCQKIVR